MLIPSIQDSGVVTYHEPGEQEAALYLSMSMNRGGLWETLPAELRGLALQAARVLDGNDPPTPVAAATPEAFKRYRALLGA